MNQKNTEVESKRKYRIVENTPKVEEKEKTLSEQIKEELEMEQEALNRSTTLLGAYIAGLKDVTNNSIIIDSKRRINLRKEKIEKLEQFSNLADDEIDESLEKVIQKWYWRWRLSSIFCVFEGIKNRMIKLPSCTIYYIF